MEVFYIIADTVSKLMMLWFLIIITYDIIDRHRERRKQTKMVEDIKEFGKQMKEYIDNLF